MASELDEVVYGFVDESTELVERVSDDIIDLETHSDPEVINRIFRAFHTIKGNSRMLGFTRLGDFTHKAEDLMSLVRAGDLAVNPAIVRALTRSVDVFIDVLEDIRESGEDGYDYLPVAKMIEEAAQGKATPPKNAPAAPKAAPAQKPTVAPEPAASGTELQKAAAGVPGGIKMLVVEDDFASRLMLTKFLTRFGEVHVAVNGSEAVEGVKTGCNEGEPYRFICMDIMMPGMDGIEAVRRIRAIERDHGCQEAVIIMITALSDPQTIIRCCYESGANYYIIKPLVFTQLEALMKRYNLIP